MACESLAWRELERENVHLRQELDVYRGVFSVLKDDLNVKNEHVDRVFNSVRAASVRESHEKQANERLLQSKLAHLKCVLRAKDVSFARMQKDLRDAHHQLYGRFVTSTLSSWTDDLMLNIFSYLDVAALGAVVRTCHAWRNILMVEGVWEALYGRRWMDSLDLASLVPESASSIGWIQKYKTRHVLERNWSTGKAIITTLSGHYGTVTCLESHGSKMVSGSDDGSLVLWSIASRTDDEVSLAQQHHRQTRTVHKLHAFYGHGGPVWALHFDGANLVSGSFDKTVKLWNVQTGRCVNTLRAHTDWVSSVDVCGPRIASGSYDSCVNIWDSATGDLVTTLVDEPANPIYCLQWEKATDVVATGCRQRGIQLWDVHAGRSILAFAGHGSGNQVNGLHVLPHLVVSGGSDAAVKVWDRRAATCVATLAGHTGAVMCVDVRGHEVLSGSYDTTIKMWDLRRPVTAVQSFAGHSAAVFALQVDPTRIISGSADSTVKIFNFHH